MDHASVSSPADYYTENLCQHVDKAFQFAYGLILNRSQARSVVYGSYEGFSKDLPLPSDLEETLSSVLFQVWKDVQKLDHPVEQASAASTNRQSTQEVEVLDQPLHQALVKLSLVQRAALLLCDHFGFTQQGGAQILGESEESFCAHLAHSRKGLMEEKL